MVKSASLGERSSSILSGKLFEAGPRAAIRRIAVRGPADDGNALPEERGRDHTEPSSGN